jgi:predicted nucleotidyltransferase component of viral defense system
MNAIVLSMLEKYQCNSRQDYENALKEIIQELALLGLWRSKFFEMAAFYGGTALRIMYGLDRFSEDLDFSLLKPDPHFDLSYYNEAVASELQGVGFTVTVSSKDKKSDSTIRSAFIKAETLTQMVSINVHKDMRAGIHKDQTLKIKMEVDINPPGGFLTEAKIIANPIPFSVLTFQKPDLFSGKMHAILCRPWIARVKGRDWYDLIWYLSHNIPVRLEHLQQRLLQSGALSNNQFLTREVLLDMLQAKIHTIDFESAKQDILPFIRDKAAVELWSKDFFSDRVKSITVI